MDELADDVEGCHCRDGEQLPEDRTGRRDARAVDGGGRQDESTPAGYWATRFCEHIGKP